MFSVLTALDKQELVVLRGGQISCGLIQQRRWEVPRSPRECLEVGSFTFPFETEGQYSEKDQLVGERLLRRLCEDKGGRI